MASRLPTAYLCDTCARLFSGRWEEESALTPAESVPDDSSTTSDFYDTPDWLVLRPGASAASSLKSDYGPGYHHSVTALAASASDGCHICNMLWVLVQQEEHDYKWSENYKPDSVVGVLVPRPWEDSRFEDLETVALELSYWALGKIEPDNFVFKMQLILHHPSDLAVEAYEQLRGTSTHSSDPLISQLAHIRWWLSQWEASYGVGKYPRHSGVDAVQPKRLLTLSGTHDQLSVSLVDTSADPTMRSEKYATLSHCWGGHSPIRLLLKNLKDFQAAIPAANLPQTFRDAMRICLDLGIPSLWIDSLCIIQDSDADWREEAAKMHDIYARSFLNIGATASENCDGGLFCQELPAKQFMIGTAWHGLPPGPYVCFDEKAWERHVENAPLNTRAWVLQERLLSQQTIHFARDQVWYTRSDSDVPFSELYPEGLVRMDYQVLSNVAVLQDETITLDDWHESYLEMVTLYSKTKLTYGSDKLIAFAGMAEAARTARQDALDYAAGLWTQFLPVDLLWHMATTGTRSSGAYRAPSWSWASVDGEVYFHSADKRAEAWQDLVMTLVDWRSVPIDSRWGAVSDGWLVLSSPLLRVSLVNEDASMAQDGPAVVSMAWDGQVLRNDDDFTESLDDESLYSTDQLGQRDLFFACMKDSVPADEEGSSHEAEGLILEKHGATGDSYKRVGWLRVFHPAMCRDMKGRPRTTYTLR